MPEIPTREELERFLRKQILEARRHGPPERLDDLLDKLADLDTVHSFVEQVLIDA